MSFCVFFRLLFFFTSYHCCHCNCPICSLLLYIACESAIFLLLITYISIVDWPLSRLKKKKHHISLNHLKKLLLASFCTRWFPCVGNKIEIQKFICLFLIFTHRLKLTFFITSRILVSTPGHLFCCWLKKTRNSSN